MTGSPRELGVFGGAFDPPHLAHMALARAALAQLSLDWLYVFPTGQSWHKAGQATAAAHRLAMTRLAFEGEARVRVDDREMRRAGPTYTVDTLRELRAEHPGMRIHLILGADQAAALPRWHEWQSLLELAIISVADRSESTTAAGRFDPSMLPQGRFERLQMPPMTISATEIRTRLAQGQGIDHLVSPGVARYIDQHHLYRTA